MRHIWLDCDPGHDDAMAIMLAIFCDDSHLLGISTVHGNASADNTVNNAARCLYAFAAPQNVLVYPGAVKPLIRPARHDPEIHGIDGLGGVQGLPSADHPDVVARLAIDKQGRPVKAIEGIAKAIRDVWNDGAGPQITLISSGPMTNIALFVSVYPELLGGIEEMVFMGGGVGRGNRTPSAEFNILCDPEAAQIVLKVPVRKTMIPINVTHTAIVTKDVLCQLLCPGSVLVEGKLPPASSNLRHMLSTLIGYFADSYKLIFGFMDGPPLHDALTIAYALYPELFSCKRYRVDVELGGAHTSGETVVDLRGYYACDETWGVTGKNCIVAEKVDAKRFFGLMLDCIARCDKVTPLNSQSSAE
ncbi:nucleoside hydrolase [Obba rivulosa]|uniref:Nucleoside hydrolase n=1 Tax=Obba rivulosa TaxID=1052685 RepID=A0A8E2DES8_9APHY|nr:nucleoside hydrolase [Obba rivulosa]